MVILVDTNIILDVITKREPFAALQEKCAEEVGAEFIITRNAGDYGSSTIQAVTPHDFLRRLGYR